jgi:hypothetical protein
MSELSRFDAFFRIVFISAASGFVGGWAIARILLTGSVETHLNTPGVAIFVPPSVVTWVILSRFVNRHSVLRAILIGAISPVVGCVVWAIIYVGLGIFWMAIVFRFYYLFMPFGILTSLAIWRFAPWDNQRPRGQKP